MYALHLTSDRLNWPPPLPLDVMEECEAAWKRSALDSTVSALHRSVCASLDRLSVPHTIEQLTDDGLLSVDVALQAQDGKRVAVEVDGPSHFTINTRRRLGATVNRDLLLQHRGWLVLSLPYFELNDASAGGALDDYVAQRVSEAGVTIVT